MQHLYSPEVFPNTVIGVVDENIKNFFRQYASDDTAMIDTIWMNDELIPQFTETVPDKHLLVYSGADPYPGQPAKHIPVKHSAAWRSIANHPAGYSLIGNIRNENYFCFWLEFIRTHMEGRFEFDPTTVDIDKVYMCLNRKPHTHRISLVRALYDHNLQDCGLISLGYPTDGLNIQAFDFLGLPVPIKLEVDLFNEEGQAAVAGDCAGISCDTTSLGHLDNWKRTFLSVVTETSMGWTDFISEKTLKPILGYKPFIVMGPSSTYAQLHDWGIDTFNDIFGADCDPNDHFQSTHEYHCEKITSLIKDLQKENLNLLYKSMLPRLKENRKNLLHACEVNHRKIISTARKF